MRLEIATKNRAENGTTPHRYSKPGFIRSGPRSGSATTPTLATLAHIWIRQGSASWCLLKGGTLRARTERLGTRPKPAAINGERMNRSGESGQGERWAKRNQPRTHHREIHRRKSAKIRERLDLSLYEEAMASLE
jgi:hypothetical protein